MVATRHPARYESKLACLWINLSRFHQKEILLVWKSGGVRLPSIFELRIGTREPSS